MVASRTGRGMYDRTEELPREERHYSSTVVTYYCTVHTVVQITAGVVKKMKPSRVQIAGPGAKPTVAVRAPFATMPDSTRGPRVEQQEKLLNDELRFLEDGTKKRNQDFYRLLEATQLRGQKWEAKLRAETEAQLATHVALSKIFDETLDSTIFAEKKALCADTERFHVEKIPPQERRMGENEQSVEIFVGETIPTVIDKQSGIVSRQLQKAHDTFDVRKYHNLRDIPHP